MNSNFVIVYSFLYPHEMEIAKHALESYGIECFSEDSLTVQSYQLISNAVGGVKLLVNKKDLKKSIEILVLKDIIPNPSETKELSSEIKLANLLNLIFQPLYGSFKKYINKLIVILLIILTVYFLMG